MSSVDTQLRHDFINNSIRIDVLIKLICKELEQDTAPKRQYIEDLEKFLNIELNMLNDLRSQFYMN